MSKPLQGDWQGYSKGDDVDADLVRASFLRKYGREPVEVVDAGGCWLAGPIGLEIQDHADEFDDMVAIGDLDIVAEQLTLLEV